jgi:aminopeptidase 2
MCLIKTGVDSVGGNGASNRQVLPSAVVPKHYDLTIDVDLKKLTYDGQVVVDLDIVEQTDSISFHSQGIEILSTTVTKGNVSIDSPTMTENKETNITVIGLSQTLTTGAAKLEIKFAAGLSEKMAGFYRATYKKSDDTEGVMATTQFQPTDARKAFPCFDEPALKAKFTVTLIAEKHFTCLSNMDVASETEVPVPEGAPAKKAVKFNTSPLMSTYLLAFVVGELNYIETNSFHVPIRVYAPPSENIEHGRYSLELAAQTLTFYEKIFGAEFPLPKLDNIAIPDFFAGAMENWGLVTYGISALLFDEEVSGASSKEGIAEIVQHELAHQWFGNLVTMDWWDGLWLNEGFATWASWVRFKVSPPNVRVYSCHSSILVTISTRNGRFGRPM